MESEAQCENMMQRLQVVSLKRDDLMQVSVIVN